MITRIELKNFMSHAHTVIEPVRGLTVLVGDNNTGKSAIINALQVLCRNISGNYMVRHGTRDCWVRVDTNEGNTLEWRRKNGTVSYRINGRKVNRLSGSVPEDLHDLLRLPYVDAEQDSFDIHFGEQKDPIFLLNSSPAKRATFFASSSDTIKLIEMQTQHKNKVRDAKKRESNLVSEETIYKERIRKLSRLDEVKPGLEYLEEQYKNISSEVQEIQELKQRLAKLSSAEKKSEYLEGKTRALQKLASPPVLEDSPALENTIEIFKNKYQYILLEESKNRIFSGLQSPPELEDTQRLSELIGDIAQQNLRIQKNRLLADKAAQLDPPPYLEDLSPLQSLIQSLSKNRQKSYFYGSQSSTLSELVQPPELFDTAELSETIQKMQYLYSEVSQERTCLQMLEKCPDPPVMNQIQEMQDLIQRMQRLLGHLDKLNTLNACLSGLFEPPELFDVSYLRDLIEKVEQALSNRDKKSAQLQNCQKQLEQVQGELRELIHATGICPTCGQKMDPENILRQTAVINNL